MFARRVELALTRTSASLARINQAASPFQEAVKAICRHLSRWLFGSGKIEAAVATDVVKVAGASARMSETLLLMISNQLRFGGAFEGLLGLGLPKSNMSSKAGQDDYALTGVDKVLRNAEKIPTKTESWSLGRDLGFLSQANVPRFSICFNDGADGVLRLSQDAAPNQLDAIGHAHWALDFGGFSVGEDSNPSPFCSRTAMRPGQVTPCTAIPDSGTTLMMGPKEQIVALFSEICGRWPRCMQKVKSPGNHSERSLVFQEALSNCGDWVNSSHGLDQEMPNLHLHMAGGAGKKRVLKLPGAGYVIEMMQDEVHYVTRHLAGILPVRLPVPTGKKKRVCTPAFGAHAYDTKLNGPVWILGLPLFYEYQVGYDLKLKRISFSEEPCGSCGSGGRTQKSSKSSLLSHTEEPRQPRLLRSPVRLPSIDVNEPL